MRERDREVIEQFRANGGQVTGPYPDMHVLLLTTTGVKSGQLRTTPITYSRDGDRFVVFASLGGAPNHPAWFLNLQAHPGVTVEVGTERFEGRAWPAEGAERDRLFAQRAAELPRFAEYQQKTTRVIPVVVIERLG